MLALECQHCYCIPVFDTAGPVNRARYRCCHCDATIERTWEEATPKRVQEGHQGQIDALLAQNARLLGLLRRVYNGDCPFCLSPEAKGHTPDCELAAALDAT